ncbi:MAG: RagB/SusD family nutrient uptake outer membrane protein [Lewinellaceae bacterium]|nr:RagB/SusD family nutrient uptake outer membrane protein [Lewinellaceae bacterium]
MKQFIRLGILSLLLLALNPACTQLDEPLYDQISTDQFFTTQTEFDQIIGPLYTNLYGLGSHGGFFSMQEISSDEVAIPNRGGDWGDDVWVRAHQHYYNAYDQPVSNAWSFLYSGILACNRILDLLDKSNQQGHIPNTELYTQNRAEARALRALYYYWLLDFFGNVPIITDYDTGNTIPTNTPRAQVFDFVEQELLAVSPLINKNITQANYGRMHYYAVQMLLAKLYLNAEVYAGTPRWNDALDACNTIINAGLYALEADYFANFKVQNQTSHEFILAVPFDAKAAPGFNLAQMTLHYSAQATYNLQQQPWNGYCSLQEFYEKYDSNDVRINNFLVGPQYEADGITPLLDSNFDDPDGPQVVYTPEINAFTMNCYRQAGVRIGKYEFEKGAGPDMSNDMPVFRFSDVLLMKAEILWRLSPSSTEALDLVNTVRKRAFEPDEDLPSLNAQTLLDERGRELFYEGVRRQDLIRFGVYGAPTEFMPGSDPCKEIMPIPAGHLNLSNLQQNPCY